MINNTIDAYSTLYFFVCDDCFLLTSGVNFILMNLFINDIFHTFFADKSFFSLYNLTLHS